MSTQPITINTPRGSHLIFQGGDSSEERSNLAFSEPDEYRPFIPSKKNASILWALLSSYLSNDEVAIQKLFVQHAEYDLSQTYKLISEDQRQQYVSMALCLRDRLIERWKDTELYFEQNHVKRVYYLSLEFLMGRSLQNSLLNLDLDDNFKRALYGLGIDMENLFDKESDPGLGNGGLGRLAACYLDSLATMNYPAWGYGLRYKYGLFMQKVKEGYQIEAPDFWLRHGNPWEIPRLDIQYEIKLYGEVIESIGENGEKSYEWNGGETVIAVAYDVPVPGYDTYNTINLRLWSATASNEFDLVSFNQGDYIKAIENKHRSETITSVLYPNDNTIRGKELRLKQQYFFVSATIRDILVRFKKKEYPLEELPEFVSIQLNDTHPTLGVPELMRILLDEENLEWSEAWTIINGVFSYTNHTVLPEALEKWPVAMLGHILPRHLGIIYKINHQFLELVEERWPGDVDKLSQLSIIEEFPQKSIRMAHLAIIASHHVNGVAAIHSQIIKNQMFNLFDELYPGKFLNVTNGVTPRRWLNQSNPGLSKLISKVLDHNKWLTDLSLLEELREHVDDEKLQVKWRRVKRANKEKLAEIIQNKLGIYIPSDALYDVQIKRLHEYKRQFLNILYVIWRYRQIKGMSDEERADVVPRVVIFGGKAAPGYYMAKLIIKLINNAADTINNDQDIDNLLKVVFYPNYNVSAAEILIPASDISQHISTAGMEASGTSNMKFALNGGLIIGTLDGANIEIREEIGEENMFIFGAEADEVAGYREKVQKGEIELDTTFQEVIDLVRNGYVGYFNELPQLIDSITHNNDWYLLSVDWAGYLSAQELVDETYKNQDLWTKMSILSTAGMGKFSSDRSVQDYANNIWNLEPNKRPGPVTVDTSKMSAEDSIAQSVSPAIQSVGSSLHSSTLEIATVRLDQHEAKVVRSFSPSAFEETDQFSKW
eukprot:TRINITY_DN7284_c0_g1_i1.p1 TRINITY_DN7284_c0_g1~~TRINITY_DN7284_c0_g1_i1.p1  ORF type:complete len:941 (+),score=214.82 TRINITY_DN7284_c0_g1_i1:169-2991(+)